MIQDIELIENAAAAGPIDRPLRPKTVTNVDECKVVLLGDYDGQYNNANNDVKSVSSYSAMLHPNEDPSEIS